MHNNLNSQLSQFATNIRNKIRLDIAVKDVRLDFVQTMMKKYQWDTKTLSHSLYKFYK